MKLSILLIILSLVISTTSWSFPFKQRMLLAKGKCVEKFEQIRDSETLSELSSSMHKALDRLRIFRPFYLPRTEYVQRKEILLSEVSRKKLTTELEEGPFMYGRALRWYSPILRETTTNNVTVICKGDEVFSKAPAKMALNIFDKIYSCLEADISNGSLKEKFYHLVHLSMASRTINFTNNIYELIQHGFTDGEKYHAERSKEEMYQDLDKIVYEVDPNQIKATTTLVFSVFDIGKSESIPLTNVKGTMSMTFPLEGEISSEEISLERL